VGPSAALFLTLALSLSGGSAAAMQSDEPAPDLARQLALLRRRAADSRGGAAASAGIARDLERIGRGYLDIGETGRAIELLEEAYGLDERNGLVLAELTLAYVRAEDFPFARFYLELAERRAAEAPPEIYATLGEAYYGLNRVEDAVLAWEQFERLHGNDPVVLKRLSRARQELSLSRGQRFLETPDFAIYSDQSISQDVTEKVSDRLSATYRAQAALFGTRLDASQVVVLYAGRSYFSLVSVPEWVSGVFDGKIRLSIDPDGGVTPALEGVLAHELAHALVRKVSNDRAPGWLHEGVAQWCEGKRVFRKDFREAFAGGRRPLSLKEMEGNLARRADRAASRANYAEALGLIEYLVQQRGEGAVVCLLDALGEGASLEDALRRETGLTGTELVSAWKAWARL